MNEQEPTDLTPPATGGISTGEIPAGEAGVSDAAERAYRAGHQLVLDRIDLLVLQVQEAAQRAGLVAVFSVTASLFLLLTWVLLVGAFVAAVGRYLSTPGAFLVAAGLHLLGAAILGHLAAKRLRAVGT